MHEFRNVHDARRWAVQGLWLMREAPASNDSGVWGTPVPQGPLCGPALELSLELASAGAPLAPLGFLADVGRIAVGESASSEPSGRSGDSAGIGAFGLGPGLIREYEDYVLGRLLADLTFQRAADAILRYQGRDRNRALAFLLTQLCERCAIMGVMLSPAILKQLREEPAADVLAEGLLSIREDGLMPLIAEQYAHLIGAVRNTADLLSAEDIFELERGTALAEFGQRLALRQVLHMSALMAQTLPARKPRVAPRMHAVATRLVAEDSYPVGGFSSLANRGTIESLLHSQLIFMESGERPDLFDIKFVRDELLYYARDENQFFRPHATFMFLLSPELVAARLKDADLPYQRIVMVLATLVTVVRTLIEWLSGESLHFQFLFLDPLGKAMVPALPGQGRSTEPAMKIESDLVKMLLADQIENGTVSVERLSPEAIPQLCAAWSRRSLVRCLWIAPVARNVVIEGVLSASLVVNGPSPSLFVDEEPIALDDAANPAEAWLKTVESLLREWIG